MAVETPPEPGQLPSTPVVGNGARQTNHHTARLVAIIAGLLGAALALATPFLPVKQTTAQLNWPQNDVLQSVNAPLIGYVATDLDINIPCSAAAGLAGPQNAGRTVLLSTVPKQAPKAIDRGLLIERVNNDLLVIVRNTPVVTAPLSQVLSPACEKLTFTAHADKVTGEFVGLVKGPDTDDPGAPLRGERSGYDFRPQIVGVFTDLAGPAPPGLQFSATVDSRYSTSPTLLKMIVMIVGVAMTIIALGALHVLDTADGMRHRRFLPPRWWSIRPLDAVGHRGAGVVALRRRQHVRRRLHPDDGQGVRARRLHGQLLPLVRHAGSAVRLVLRPAGAVGARQHQQRLGPAADAADGADLLVGDQSRGDPAARPRRQDEPSGQVDRGGHVPGVLAAVEQRATSRADHRARHPADVVLRRARRGHQQGASGGDRDHHRSTDPLLRPDGYRRRRRAARRGWSAENHCGQPYFAIRLSRAAGTRAGGVYGHDLLDLPRPDVRRGDPGKHVQVGRRPEPELVRRTHPLRALVHGHPGRVGRPPIRCADGSARAGGVGGDDVA